VSVHHNDGIRRIEAFTDTDGRHREYHYDHEPAADIFVCAGDVCEAGDEAQLKDFFA